MLKKLEQQKFTALARAKELNAKVGDDTISAEERTELAATMTKIATLNADIAVAKALAEEERTAPAAHDAVVGENLATKKPWGEGRGGASAALGEMMIAVKDFRMSKGHRRDERLFATATGQNETIDAEGGFLVQPDVAPDLLKRTFDAGVVSSRCRTRPVSSSRMILNGVVDDNRVGGPAGAGIIVVRAAEASSVDFSKIKFRRVELNMNKLMGFYKATDEVLEDAPTLQAEVFDYFPDAFSWRIDNEVINGTGAGQFLGVLTSNVAVVVPKVAGQAAGTIVALNILDMITRLWVRSRANAVFFVGPDVEAVLRTLTIPGPQGTNVAMYTPAGMYGNKYGMLEGIPVIPIEQTAYLGTQGDIILADCNEYMIGERNSLQFASSIHVQFLTEEQVFRWTLRNDGQPLWDKPVTQNNSANKVSPFVVLQTRS